MKLRKIRKNSKALSPVVASIILIAVTVAVSIAVAAWMGALTIGFMQTEELKITNMQFNTGEIALNVKNVGTSPVTLDTSVLVNGLQDDATFDATSEGTIPANGEGVVYIAYTWEAGASYQVRISSSQGNTFTYTAVAPSA